MAETILYEASPTGKVAIIRFNRPEKLNAMHFDMDRAWGEAIERANAAPEVGAIIVTGNGRAFCAGADFKERFRRRLEAIEQGLAFAPPDPLAWINRARESKPLIAAVNGLVLGMGLTMILPFDVIIASSQAQFGAPFVKVGLVPEVASTRFLVGRMGFGRASEFLLSARTISAEEAVASGLADRLVPHERLMEVALEVAESIAANPALQLRLTKRLLTENAVESDLAAVCARENEALEEARHTPEHRAAIERFLNR